MQSHRRAFVSGIRKEKFPGVDESAWTSSIFCNSILFKVIGRVLLTMLSVCWGVR